jgi:hypothetical protein
MDRTQLAAEHPALVESILAEGRTAGATAERERILAIEAAAIPGHDALIAKLKGDSSVDAGAAALQILAAERTARVAAGDARASEAPAPLRLVPAATVQPSAAEKDQVDQSLPIEERCKQSWDKDAAIRAEFGTLSAYTAHTRAAENGQVKVLNKR